MGYSVGGPTDSAFYVMQMHYNNPRNKSGKSSMNVRFVYLETSLYGPEHLTLPLFVVLIRIYSSEATLEQLILLTANIFIYLIQWKKSSYSIENYRTSTALYIARYLSDNFHWSNICDVNINVRLMCVFVHNLHCAANYGTDDG